MFVCCLFVSGSITIKTLIRQNYNNTIIIRPRRHKGLAESYQCPRYKSLRDTHDNWP